MHNIEIICSVVIDNKKKLMTKMLDPSISTNQNAIEIKNRNMFVVEQKANENMIALKWIQFVG